MGTPIEGFFDRANMVAKAMASTSIVVQGVPTEAPILSVEPGPIEEGT